jgi:hypothetical protein
VAAGETTAAAQAHFCGHRVLRLEHVCASCRYFHTCAPLIAVLGLTGETAAAAQARPRPFPVSAVPCHAVPCHAILSWRDLFCSVMRPRCWAGGARCPDACAACAVVSRRLGNCAAGGRRLVFIINARMRRPSHCMRAMIMNASSRTLQHDCVRPPDGNVLCTRCSSQSC